MIDIIDQVKDQKVLQKAIDRYREKGIILPTFDQMQNPQLVPDKIQYKLKKLGLWELDPMNLFRINWKNEPVESGGAFGKVNYLELPEQITGVKARIVLMLGKYFPTGAHKVGAAYGCLVPRIITGQFDPTYHKAVWPSTGNYCRGGAFDSYLMDVTAVAILPEEMSRERFTWLEEIGAEVIATPGCESNVKEIYDKCWDIRKNRKDAVIFNQFEEFGNAAWHYKVTGHAIEEIFNDIKTDQSRMTSYVSATGSAGTIAAGDYLRSQFPHVKVVASEALQCPTLLSNGFGGHRIEGIGDKHVPWIHNVKNTNMVAAIDDEDSMRLLRLFNEKSGLEFLKDQGLDPELVNQLHLIGISGLANLLSAIKVAKYYEMDNDDVIITVATDAADMYQSRLHELEKERGVYREIDAMVDFHAVLKQQSTAHLKELNYMDQKAIHNLKYFTWIEQQAKELEDLNSLWYDKQIWSKVFNQTQKWDELINEFNERTGLLKKL